MKKFAHLFFFVGIIAIAFILRYLYMPSHLFFGPEQGRDFLVIRDIVINHKMTLIGSKTDTAGIFHGPIFYYLASIPFALTHGDPIAVFMFLVLIQSVSVFLAYQLTFDLCKSKRAGYIAAIMFAVGYVFIVYARWLSNPPLSIPLSMLLMLSLSRFIQGKPKYLVIAAIMYGLVGQAEFINYLLFGIIGILILAMYWKQFITTKLIVIVMSFAAGLVTSFGTYILFDFRHNFLISKAVLDLVLGKGVNNLSLWTSIAGAFRVLMEQCAQITGLFGWGWGALITALAMYTLTKRLPGNSKLRLLIVWFWVPPIFLAILRHGMLDQLYAGVIAGAAILFALALDWLWEKKSAVGITVLSLVVGINVYTGIRNFSVNNQIFFQPQQSAVRYTDQLAVLDWVYVHAQGQPFSFQSFTVPYFIQDAWIYLLQYYALPKYGYLPDNLGRKRIFIIIQNDPNDSYNSLFRKNWHTSITREWKSMSVREQIGDYTVEEWML